MVPSVQHYFQEGLAPSTRKAYNSAMKRFWGFCELYNVVDPFPVTEHLLCAFAAHLADAGLAGQTIKAYLAAVRNTQLSMGLPPRSKGAIVTAHPQTSPGWHSQGSPQSKPAIQGSSPNNCPYSAPDQAGARSVSPSREESAVGSMLHSLFWLLPAGRTAPPLSISFQS